jgi:hypothetical protein
VRSPRFSSWRSSATVLLALRYGPAALLPALPALALTAPFFDERPRVALLGVGVTAAIAAAAWGSDGMPAAPPPLLPPARASQMPFPSRRRSST